MTKPGSLTALLKRTTQQAGNVVRFERATGPDTVTEKAEPAPLVKPAPDGADDDDYAELLAPLDALLREQEARAARPAPAVEAVTPAAVVAMVPPSEPRVTVLPSAMQGIDLVNRMHFTAPLSGEVTVWREGIDHETGRRTVTPVSMNSVRLEFAPYTVNVATPGGIRSMPLADLWFRGKHRREYPGGVILQPEGPTPLGCFNLWQGFGVNRKAGDPSPMIDHVHMLCGGVAELADYVLNWFALCVQRPGSRPEVALVLRGGRGTGKGTVFRIMLVIFGRHGLHITQPKHLIGNFNSHLRTALFLFADECHWPGDKSAEGVLKGLITEPSIAVEMKGRDVFTAPNRIKLGMASNNDWIVPAGADERRYCVIDVSTERAQDHAYFGALNNWIDGDGASIFLDHLLTRDLSGFNVRAVPKTAALDRQKIEGMSPLDRCILEALDTGTGMGGDEWTDDPQRVVCDVAVTRFDMYCKRAVARGSRADTRTIGRRFVEVFGCRPAASARTSAGIIRRAWTLPGISQARAMAASAFGLAQYEWGAA